MLFARDQAVKFLMALLLLCACAPTPVRVPVDSKTARAPIETLAPTYTKTIPTATRDAAVEVFQGPLSVIIKSPADNAVVQVSPVEINGEANPETVISINDVVILVDEKRTFQALIPLQPGENLIEITASDVEGKQDFAYLTLLYEP